LVIPDIIAFTISGITDIIAISDISTFTIGGSKKCKKCTQKIKKNHKKSKKNAHQKSSLLNTKKCKKKCTQKYNKMKKTHRNCKNHTKNAKIDISGITDILLGFSPYWLSPITNFHHIGDNRYYRDILESVTSLSVVDDVLHDFVEHWVVAARVCAERTRVSLCILRIPHHRVGHEGIVLNINTGVHSGRTLRFLNIMPDVNH
jgi:hypothetical protein